MESILGEIKLWAINFAPTGWQLCDGSLLPIQSYAALYSLLGTAYGGNGTTTFALPDLRGRVPVGTGNQSGTTYDRGMAPGQESVGLSPNQMPQHTHDVNAYNANGNAAGGLGHHVAGVVTNATPPEAVNLYGPAGGATVVLDPASVSSVGGDQAHNNMQPYLALNYYICTNGLYPQRP